MRVVAMVVEMEEGQGVRVAAMVAAMVVEMEEEEEEVAME